MTDATATIATEELQVLGQTKHDAPHAIIASQGAGAGFSNVSQYWIAKCMTFEQGRKLLAEQQDQIQDFKEPLKMWQAVVTDAGTFALRHLTTGRDYDPTDHALGLMCQVGRGMSDWQVRALRQPIEHPTKVDDEGEKVAIEGGERTADDADILVRLFNAHLFNPARVDQDKIRLFRTWDKAGSLRAFLSDQYAIVNNGWYLSLLEKLIPGGLLSHWKGDADSIYGNVLLPDSVRAEADSDYGGMLSVGNSEIGLRRISSLPSVFRAICMNGCIWEQEKGVEIDIRHRGKVDFEQLAAMIKDNLEKQIPLLDEGTRRLLALRQFGTGDVSLRNIFALLSAENSLGKKDITGIREAFGVELGILGPKEGMTAFGLTNAITRHSQTLPAEKWVKMDQLGGAFANLDREGWDKFLARAKNLTDKQIDKRLGSES